MQNAGLLAECVRNVIGYNSNLIRQSSARPMWTAWPSNPSSIRQTLATYKTSNPAVFAGHDAPRVKSSSFHTARVLSSAGMFAKTLAISRGGGTMAEERCAAPVFDESRFSMRLSLQALRVPKQFCSQVSKILSGYVIDRPRVKHIVLDPTDTNSRLVILSDSVKDPSLREIPEDKLNPVKDLVNVDVVPHEVLLGYEHWPVDHVLKDILPPDCDVPSSFETIGHIAHLNLRDEHMLYKEIIGRVIFDKNQPKIRTVVNKVGTIENEFRVPSFEVLAGEQNMVTEVKQYGATFRLDYGLVYWNSRLEHEHKRLISQFQPGQVICDMFSGIGPFAIPAAQKGCLVYANDLNPSSIKYLVINAEINKVKRRIVDYNMDAREFMQGLMNPTAATIHVVDNTDDNAVKKGTAIHLEKVKEGERSKSESRPDGRAVKAKKDQGNCLLPESKPWEHFDHVVMNLPATALEFLDTFNGLISKNSWKGSMPRIHCYCFMRAKETIADIIKRAENAMGGSLAEPSIWTVRDVAPNKTMLCISFNLPESVAFRETPSVARSHSPDVSLEAASLKRPRTV